MKFYGNRETIFKLSTTNFLKQLQKTQQNLYPMKM